MRFIERLKNTIANLLCTISFKTIIKESKNNSNSKHKTVLNMAKKTVITEVQDVEVMESILEFPQNRAFLTEQLTADDPTRPEIVKGLKTVDNVFAHYKPKVNVDFQDSEGVSKKEKLVFNSLGDFGVKGIVAQSEFLKNLNLQVEEYQKIIKQLKSNKQLKQVLNDIESKQAMLNAIHALLKELDT